MSRSDGKQIEWEDAPQKIAARVGSVAGPVAVVGIAGAVGSGKSTLARRLAAALGGVVLATDRYLPDYAEVPMSERDLPERSHLSELVEHVRQLRSGRGVEVPRWSFFTHRREGTERLDPAPVLVVEGIHAMQQRVRSVIDIGVLVHANRDTRWDRLVARELAGERGWSIEHMREHFETVAEPTWRARAEEYRVVADAVVMNG